MERILSISLFRNVSDILFTQLLGNTVLEYIVAVIVLVLGFGAILIFKRRILLGLKHWAARTPSGADDFFVRSLARRGVPLLFFIVLYIGLSLLTYPFKVERAINIAFLIIFTFLGVLIITDIVRRSLYSYLGKKHPNLIDGTFEGIVTTLNVLIWIVAALYLVNNFGYNVTTIITGLGIGGIALALASQTVLADLFSYYAILFDRPFERGDYVYIADDMQGMIDRIGLKTTRIRSLSGEELVVANSDLTKTRLKNFKRMERRWSEFKFKITYETPLEQIREIPQIVKGVIGSVGKSTADRVNLSSFGDSGLIFSAAYFIESADYKLYVETQEKINLRIMEEFAKRKIKFAYPTQTAYNVEVSQ